MMEVTENFDLCQFQADFLSKDLSDEAMKVIEASKKDDDLDEDKDGKKDVDQIDAKALLLRKTNLVLTKMNPQKVRNYIIKASKYLPVLVFSSLFCTGGCRIVNPLCERTLLSFWLCLLLHC